MNLLKKISQAWDQFWFGPVSFYNLGVLRFVLGLTLFFMNIGRQFDVELYYTDKGFLPRSMSLEIVPEFMRPAFAWFVWPEQSVWLAHLVYLFCLLIFAFGFGGRLINLLAWVLHISFMQRNLSIAFGADMIGGIFLFLLIGTNACREFSLANKVLKLKKTNSVSLFDATASQFFSRMIQLQLCIIYMYTGFEKLKGATWWDGTALWSVFANPQMVITDLGFFRHLPIAIGVFSFTTILFEVYWGVLVWFKKTRPLVLIMGAIFHIGIGFVMALWGFAFVMLAPYILFLEPEQLRSIIQTLKSKVLFRAPFLKKTLQFLN